MRKTNTYGVPIFTQKETAILRDILVRPPCKVCGAKSGKLCKSMQPGQVHMGRLPNGFDSEKAVDAALAASPGPRARR